MRPAFEVADVLRAQWQEVLCHPHINRWQLRTLGAIKRCRTSDMGGHMDACTQCGTLRISYNSCRNRHCPKCQGKNREEWIQKRESELLPVPYFHLVFTLPDLFNLYALSHPEMTYDLLFESAWETLKQFGQNPKELGALTGMIAILHTWGQTLSLHPHLHCIVPGGGFTADGKWKQSRSRGKFLFHVKALSNVFRGKFMAKLKQWHTARNDAMDKKFLNRLYANKWVVYAKRPFAGSHAIVEYLGRYTHKIAISNHRIQRMDNGKVSFTYKDYRKDGKKFEMTLDGMEFIRRFSLHILPKGFVRIRHYGLLSSTSKKRELPAIKTSLPEVGVKNRKKEMRKIEKFNPHICPACGCESMVTIEVFYFARLLKRGDYRRAPPEWYWSKDSEYRTTTGI